VWHHSSLYKEVGLIFLFALRGLVGMQPKRDVGRLHHFTNYACLTSPPSCVEEASSTH
jgi:hypothetical protein